MFISGSLFPWADIAEGYTLFVGLFLIDNLSVLEPYISLGLASFIFLFPHNGDHTSPFDD